MTARKPRQKEYEKRLAKLTDMKGKAGLAAYDRATLIAALAQDQEYQTDNELSTPTKVYKSLNPYVEDLCISAKQMHLLLQHYPDRAQWGSGRLQAMLNEMMAALAEAKKDDAKPRKHATLQQVAELEAQIAELEAQLAEAKEQIKQKDELLSEKEAENTEIRTALTKAEGKLELLMEERAAAAA